MKKQFSLDAGSTLQLKNVKKLSLVCNEGTAWITNPGDQKDYIIHQGETLELDVKSRRTPVVIGSFKSHVELEIIKT